MKNFKDEDYEVRKTATWGSSNISRAYLDGLLDDAPAYLKAGSDHGLLGGLSDDDHSQYLIRNKTTYPPDDSQILTGFIILGDIDQANYSALQDGKGYIAAGDNSGDNDTSYIVIQGGSPVPTGSTYERIYIDISSNTNGTRGLFIEKLGNGGYGLPINGVGNGGVASSAFAVTTGALNGNGLRIDTNSGRAGYDIICRQTNEAGQPASFSVTSGGTLYAKTITGDAKPSKVKTRKGDREVWFNAIEQLDVVFYHSGRIQLINKKFYVELEKDFIDCVESNSIIPWHIIVTPHFRGYVWVSKVNNKGFEINADQDGEVSFLLIARRIRFADSRIDSLIENIPIGDIPSMKEDLRSLKGTDYERTRRNVLTRRRNELRKSKINN